MQVRRIGCRIHYRSAAYGAGPQEQISQVGQSAVSRIWRELPTVHKITRCEFWQQRGQGFRQFLSDTIIGREVARQYCLPHLSYASLGPGEAFTEVGKIFGNDRLQALSCQHERITAPNSENETLLAGEAPLPEINTFITSWEISNDRFIERRSTSGETYQPVTQMGGENPGSPATRCASSFVSTTLSIMQIDLQGNEQSFPIEDGISIIHFEDNSQYFIGPHDLFDLLDREPTRIEYMPNNTDMQIAKTVKDRCYYVYIKVPGQEKHKSILTNACCTKTTDILIGDARYQIQIEFGNLSYEYRNDNLLGPNSRGLDEALMVINQISIKIFKDGKLITDLVDAALTDNYRFKIGDSWIEFYIYSGDESASSTA